jgi:predicted  nucleic acid-binding Zn-ribbon protein
MQVKNNLPSEMLYIKKLTAIMVRKWNEIKNATIVAIERVRQQIEKLKKEQKNLNEKIDEKDLSRY